MSRAAEYHREAARSWMIVAGVLVLAVLIDVVRERDGDDRRTRKRS